MDKQGRQKALSYLIAGCGIILFYLFLSSFKVVEEKFFFFLGLIQPFIVGFAIAFLVNIPLSFIENKILTEKVIKSKGLRRMLSIVIVFVILILFLTLIVWLIVPNLIYAFSQLQNSLPTVVDNVVTWINQTLTSMGMSYQIPSISSLTLEDMLNSLRTFFFQNSSGLVETTISFLQAFLQVITSFFISLIFAIYMLIDKENMIRRVNRIFVAILSTKVYQDTVEFGSFVSSVFKRFFVGQFVECLLLGVLFFVGMSIFNFPYATMIAVMTGTFALVPYIGGYTSMAIGVVLIASVSPEQALWFYVFNQVIHEFSNDVIYPKIVGKSVGLPAILVVISVLAFGSLFGPLGMILAVPTCSIAYTMIGRWVNKRLEEKAIRNEEVNEEI